MTPRERNQVSDGRSTLQRWLRPAPEAPETAAARARERNRRAVLGASAAFVARGLTLVASLLTVPLALPYLGPERYGMWLTISSMIGLLTFADFGLGYGLLNSVTQSIARGDIAVARRQISSAFVALTAVAAGLAILGLFAVLSIPWERVLAVTSDVAMSEAGPAVGAFMAIFLVGLPLSVATHVRAARQEVYIVHSLAAIGSLASIVAMVSVIAAGGGVPALVVAMAGPSVAAVATNSLWLFLRSAPELAPTRRLAELGLGVQIMRSGFLFLVLQMAVVVAFATDTLVLAQLLGPEAVAQYGVALRLFQVPLGLVVIATTPLWPAYGEAIARADLAWVNTTLRRSVVAAVMVTVPLAALLVAFGDHVAAAWAGGIVALPASLLLAFGFWTIQGSIGHAISMFLNGANEIRLQAIAGSIMAIANIGISIWLTSKIGVAGVVWGTVISYALFVLAPMAAYVPGVLRRVSAGSS